MSQVKIVDRAVLSRLRDEAKTLAAPGLRRCGSDGLLQGGGRATASSTSDGREDEETKTFFTRSSGIFEESNKFVEGVFTQDYSTRRPGPIY